jgi:glycine hydroxymethyltransferase
MPGIQGGPMMHVIAAKAVAFKLAMQPEFKQYQVQIVANARAMAGEFMRLGLPIVSGGTDTHMFLIDLTETGLSGEQALRLLAAGNITVNRNPIPDDPRKPSEASGIRLGTPAITTRGMKEEESRLIARWVAEILRAQDPAKATESVQPQVLELCARFPIPQ